jgi:hypothetical protein
MPSTRAGPRTDGSYGEGGGMDYSLVTTPTQVK